MSTQVRPVFSLAELAQELWWKVEEADEEIARVEVPGETLPGLNGKRPTVTQRARYVAELRTKREAWVEVLAAMGEDI